MSDHNMSTTTGSESAQPSDFKGKGKAADPPQDMSMEDDDESSSDEEEGVEEEPVPEEEDEDNMEEITTDNIVGSRTRGKTGVDYAKAAANTEDLDDDEDDDEDFEAHEDDAMQE